MLSLEGSIWARIPWPKGRQNIHISGAKGETITNIWSTEPDQCVCRAISRGYLNFERTDHGLSVADRKRRVTEGQEEASSMLIVVLVYSTYFVCSNNFDLSRNVLAIMVELTRLKHVRAGHKSTATKWIGEVDGLATAAEGGTQPDKVRLAQLKKGLQEQHETLDRLSKDNISIGRGRGSNRG